MSGGLAGPRGRDTGLVWGIVAAVCIAPVLFASLRSSDTTDDVVFDRPVSLTVLVLALLLTAIGAVVSVVVWYGGQDWSSGRRWSIAGPLLAVAVAVVVLGIGSMAGSETSGDVVLGGLLLVATAGMAAVAAHLVRVRATGGRDRLRERFEQIREDRS
ncbi:hypothetical protein ACLQ28_30320 [Micromonospora sp. DT201]|uniref:hypothetical protein n=1 Tax=Micromonospora sp. DT201 TaxID=3393442 RepID=UPI003CF9A864